MEDWDDSVPAWVAEAKLTEYEALQELMEAAEFLTTTPLFSFEGLPGAVENDGELEIQTIHLKDFPDIDLRMCRLKGRLHTMALCHSNRETPQIILKAPAVFTGLHGSSEE